MSGAPTTKEPPRMQHSIHTAARRKRRQTIKRLARRGAAVLAIAVSGTTAAVGFSVAGADGSGPGTVVATGDAKAFGSASGNAITGMARTPSGEGYLLATNRGAVFAFGDATFQGSLPAGTSSSIVDIAATPDGQGYWLVAADGGIFVFGSAAFNGSAGSTPLNQPIVGMAATPTGEGYWLVARDGGVFNFGDAPFLGSTGGTRLNQPIVGMAATPGGGYWLVARDGGIFAFGDATFQGSAGALPLNEPIVGMASTPTGEGYWLVARDGGIFTYGDAGFHGSLANAVTGPVVDVEGSPSGAGTWVTIGGRYLGEFELTCYALRGLTASGVPVRRNGIAVDPRVIPLGTEVYIAGEGTATAIDTGGLIKGNRIDVWRPSAAECREFGRQTMPVFGLT
ncbi:MAG TPA: 3D domain-containing protein [Acidimicrobiales bacterium]|nr:3D domain-containing protein [Acidimicrobiales bacterium]